MKTFIELRESFNSNKFIINAYRVCCDHEELVTSIDFEGTKEEVLKAIAESEYFNMHNVYFVAYDVDYFDYEINQMLQECDQWFAENTVDDLPF